MKIREAVDTDAADILRMAMAFADSTNYGKLLKPVPAMLEELIDQVMQMGTILVAEDWSIFPVNRKGEHERELVGMIALVAMPHPMNGETVAEELAWWVEPRSRGGSVGPRLLQAAEQWACKKGIHMLKMVAPAHTDVGEFYRRRGYLEVETAWVKVL